MKNTIIITSLVIIVLLLSGYFILFNSNQRINDIDDEIEIDTVSIQTSENETMCCNNCLEYGEYDESKDCYEIIQENGGMRTCYMFFTEEQYTYSRCFDIVNR